MTDLVTRSAIKATLTTATKLTQAKLENLVDSLAINSEVASVSSALQTGLDAKQGLPPVFLWSPQQSKSLNPSIGAAPTLTRASTGKYLNASGVWTDAASDVARFHHRLINGTVKSVGVLCEPARTNLLLRSGNISAGDWTTNNLTLGAVTSPDGTSNAYTLTESSDGAATFHRIYQGCTVAAATTYTVSIFYKPIARSELYGTNSSGFINFEVVWNTDSRSVSGLLPGQTGLVEAYPNGWFRLSVTTPSSGAGSPLIQFWTYGAKAAFYQGSGLLCGTVWCPQCEAGTEASSPIITAGATVTRAGDVLVLSDFSLAASGMIVAKTSMPSSVVNANFVSANDTTASNVISFGRGAANFASSVVSGGAASFSGSVTKVFVPDQFVTSGVSYSTTNSICAVDGTLGIADTAVVLPANLTQIEIAKNLNGCIASLAIYDYQNSNSAFGQLTGDYTDVLPNAAAINFSDYASIDSNSTRVKLLRDLTFGNYEYSQPGGRIRFNTTCPEVRMRFTTDALEGGSTNGIGTLFVNGTEVSPVVMLASSGVEMEVVVTGSGNRLVEFVLPYSRSVSFLGLRTFGNGSVIAPVARPTLKYAFVGDSITQGFNSSRSTKSWHYLLAGLKSAQTINYGFGSMAAYDLVTFGIGTKVAQKAPDRIVCCMGYNDFASQQPLATYKANMQNFLNQVRVLLPTVKVYMGGPWYTSNTDTLTPAMYRTQVSDLVTAAADANTIYLNTLAASTTNTPIGFTDNVHPSDAVHQEIATYLNGVIS